MARKENQAAEMIDPTTDAHDAALSGAATELAATVHDKDRESVFSAGVDIGRLEALDFVVTVTSSAILPIYENVKKSKAWMLLRNPKSGHGDHFTSFDEFCEVKLGKSNERLRKILANRNAIGQDVFDQAEKLGLRQVDYNAIKALPAPEQELVRRAVEEAKTRDEVVELIQELAARFATTRLELHDATETLKSRDTLIGEKVEKESKLEKEIALLKRKGQAVAFTDGCHIFSTLIGKIDEIRRQLNLSMGELDQQISAALAVEVEEVDMPAAAHAYEALAQAIHDALEEPAAKIFKATQRFETFISPLADAALAA